MNRSIQRFSLIIFLLVFSINGFSQGYQQLLNNPGLPAATTIQPAYLAPLMEGPLRISIDGGTRFHSTAIPLSWVNQEDQFLDGTEKAQLLNAIDGREDLWSDFSGQILVQKNIKGHRLSIGFSQIIDLKATIPDEELAELALYGNAGFQNQTKSGQDLQLLNSTTRTLQLGYARTFGASEQIRWGVTVSGIQGVNISQFDLQNASLFTGPDGDSILLQAEYDNFNGTSGWGVAAATGLEWKINQSLRINAAISNIGLINWNGSGRSVSASFGTSGIDAGPLFQDLFPLNDSLFRLDTLNQQFLPDPTEQTYSQSLLPRGHIGVGYSYEQLDLFGAIHWQAWVGNRVIPGASLSAMYSFQKKSTYGSPQDVLSLGLNFSTNQWQQFGIGAMVKGVVPLGNDFITIYAMADQLQSYLTPDSGTAGSLRGGILYLLY